jgi:alpha-1,2-mannosyltransferase
MVEQRRHRVALTVGLAILVVVLGGIALNRALRGRYDFHHFYLDAHYAWQHHALNPVLEAPDPDDCRQLPFYLPTVTALLAPLTAAGHTVAALLWTLGHMLALVTSVGILWRWGQPRDGGPPVTAGLMLALAVALPAQVEAAKFNQLSYFILVLVLLGLHALERRRPALGGAILGAAAVIKLLPAVFIVWLVAKRQWRAVGGFVLGAAIVAIMPPLLMFGPARTWQHHVEWWACNVEGDAAAGMLNADLPEHFIDRRNQSIPQVLARWTWVEHPYRTPVQPAHLTPATCRRIAYGVMAALAAVLVLATRRPARDLALDARRAEAATYAIGMLVFAPLLRQYYLVWCLPALVVLAYAAADPTRRRAWRLGWIGLAVWLVGMVAWIWPLPRELGAHLLMLIVLGAIVLRCGHLRADASGAAEAPPDTDTSTVG